MESIKYSFMPVVTLGLRDSVGPHSLAIVLVFLVLLLSIGRNYTQINIFGAVFFVAYFWFNFTILLGSSDVILNFKAVPVIARYSFFVIAVCFIIFGALKFIDSYRLRKTSGLENALIKFPAYLFNKGVKEGRGRSRWFGPVRGFIAMMNRLFVLGFAAYYFCLILASSPKDYYMFLLYYFMLSQEHVRFAIESFFVYSLFFCVPVIVAWIVATVIFQRIKASQISALIYLNLFLSVASVALGFSLLYFGFS